MFYSKGHMPDNPSASCCNEADCYPTEIKFVDGNTIVRRERPRQSRDHESLEPRDAGRRQGQGA
jgi:hypothetical protein